MGDVGERSGAIGWWAGREGKWGRFLDVGTSVTRRRRRFAVIPLVLFIRAMTVSGGSSSSSSPATRGSSDGLVIGCPTYKVLKELGLGDGRRTNTAVYN